jgi:hypothetical protein
MKNRVMSILENRSENEKEEIFKPYLDEANSMIDFDEDFRIEYITLVLKKIED